MFTVEELENVVGKKIKTTRITKIVAFWCVYF